MRPGRPPALEGVDACGLASAEHSLSPRRMVLPRGSSLVGGCTSLACHGSGSSEFIGLGGEQGGFSALKLGLLEQGNSRVYKAIDLNTLRVLALKEVTCKTRRARDMVRNEISALTRLTDLPSIVSYCGWSRDNFEWRCPTVTIAMGYEAGRTLQTWVNEGGPRSSPWLARIASSMLSALGALRERGIVHRDIKPSNILLTRDGDCRLTDFGLAVSIHDEDGLGKMAGTRMYMAPERMCVEKYSFESDVYSLGLSLATVSLGYCPIPQVVGDFELLESAESLTTTLTEMATTESLESELLGFLVPMVEPHARDRPSIEALMATPFIRHQCPLWPSTDACSEVLKHLRMIVESHKWSRRVEPTKVIEDIVRCRAEQNCMTPDLSILDLEPLAQELDMTTCELAHQIETAARLSTWYGTPPEDPIFGFEGSMRKRPSKTADNIPAPLYECPAQEEPSAPPPSAEETHCELQGFTPLSIISTRSTP